MDITLEHRADAGRPVRITTDFVKTAAGSCLIETGETRVICTASVEEGVPPFLRGQGKGWLTAEYAMLPASTGRRKNRDGVKKDGRGVEIGRLIGRALRQAVDLSRLGERTVTIDCDVLTADGGTRTASITGGFVALVLAVDKLMQQGKLKESPVLRYITAISCGVIDNVCRLDLDYALDSNAQCDINVVMDGDGGIVEVQGTGEKRPVTMEELTRLLALAQRGNRRLAEAQRQALGEKAALIGQKQVLVLATGNAHKVDELRQMLGDLYDVRSMRDVGFDAEIEENGLTFEENAVIKAEAVCRRTGYLTVADDSGLCVDALDGAPGVHSARYAGMHGDDAANNQKLVGSLADVPEEKRGARFVSVLALASPFQKTLVFEGVVDGRIVLSPRGRQGFGYDPHFELPLGKTFAEMSMEEKALHSHRARAMDKLRAYLLVQKENA